MKQQELIRQEQQDIRQSIERARQYENEQKVHRHQKREEYREQLAAQIVELERRNRLVEEREQQEIEKFKQMEQEYTAMAKREIENVGQRK